MIQQRMAIGALLMVALASATSAQAIELFRDEMTNAAAWGKNAITTDNLTTFNYDYSADGVPEAPNSLSGDAATSGVKLESNLTAGALDGFSLYPIGQNFTGTFNLRFDAWMNFDADEALFGEAAGTTEFMGGGVGYDNTSPDVGVGAQLIATSEGGSGSDWRAFEGGTFVAAADMIAEDRNGANAYYSDFLFEVAPPAAQGQSVLTTSVGGSPGFQWITYDFEVLANGAGATDTVLVTIEKPDGSRLPIVELNDIEADGNIMLFYADFFSSVTARPDLTFGLIDNVVVTSDSAPLTGDYDSNGEVGSSDYDLWASTYGDSVMTGVGADGNGDGVINAADYTVWRDAVSVSSLAVPEPSAALLAVGAVAMGGLRRRIAVA